MDKQWQHTHTNTRIKNRETWENTKFSFGFYFYFFSFWWLIDWKRFLCFFIFFCSKKQDQTRFFFWFAFSIRFSSDFEIFFLEENVNEWKLKLVIISCDIHGSESGFLIVFFDRKKSSILHNILVTHNTLIDWIKWETRIILKKFFIMNQKSSSTKMKNFIILILMMIIDFHSFNQFVFFCSFVLFCFVSFHRYIFLSFSFWVDDVSK